MPPSVLLYRVRGRATAPFPIGGDMELSGRRMCDRCGEEIHKGETWFYHVCSKQELCLHCMPVVEQECSQNPIFECGRDSLAGEIRIFTGCSDDDA